MLLVTRNEYLKIKLTLIAIFLHFTYGVSQVNNGTNSVILRDCKFYSYHDESNKFIYLSSNEKNADEIELYIYNSISHNNSLISRENIKIEEVAIRWGNTEDQMLFSNGNGVFKLDVSSSIDVKAVLETKGNRVTSFSLSKDNNFIACWIGDNKSRSFAIVDVLNSTYEIIYNIEIISDELVYDINPLIEWSDNDNLIYTISPDNRLLRFDLSAKISNVLDENIRTDFLVKRDDFLFYAKNDELFKFNTLNEKKLSLINVDGLRVNYFHVVSQDIYLISFLNNVLKYDGIIGKAEIIYKSDLSDKIVYCNENVIIEHIPEGLKLSIYSSR
jgi:hypothetical protein